MGMKFKGSNGGSIFLPAAGYSYESMLLLKGSGTYWSGTLTSDSSEASYLLFFSSVRTLTDKNFRYTGNPVRAVTSHLKGDVNEDNKVTITDAVKIISKVNGGNPTNFNEKAADVTRDNTVTVNDAVGVVNMILKKKSDVKRPPMQ